MLADGSLKPLDGALRQKVQAVIDDMASKALRCMTLAQKTELGELQGCQCGMGKLMSCSWQHALADPSRVWFWHCRPWHKNELGWKSMAWEV